MAVTQRRTITVERCSASKAPTKSVGTVRHTRSAPAMLRAMARAINRARRDRTRSAASTAQAGDEDSDGVMPTPARRKIGVTARRIASAISVSWGPGAMTAPQDKAPYVRRAHALACAGAATGTHPAEGLSQRAQRGHGGLPPRVL
jgi:hypothetical protein